VFVDYYEVLQISPNADQETVYRIYRIQAQRFHPDNLATGNAETFRKVADAYEVLSNPDRRAAYDDEYRKMRRQAAHESFIPPKSVPDVKDEGQKREEIMLLLYTRRLANPGQPSVALRDFETILGTPKEYLEFSLWYLKEKGYLTRDDRARHTITLEGVELAESMKKSAANRDRADTSGPPRLDSGA
jgi:curved DNA-binding protein